MFALPWYDDQRDGLGDELVEKVSETLRAIQVMPGRFKVEVGGYRRALVQRFPYRVVFRFDDERVVVIGVYHTSRDPQLWFDRIAEDKADPTDE
ncbi:MAG TPA: type II toxin-antitoxin system RelE/ParE family toxin [Gemmataceae bacterium]|jgi:plasmid stabilization system protein ParE|nr:type II toxin-antitoxin system RelE/ParE family toxin [Gemmataceae bacterium]